MLIDRAARVLAAVAVTLTVFTNYAPGGSAQGVKRHLFAREFYKVSDTFYCGSELDSQENMHKLKEMGIKTVIDLRVFAGVKTEQAWCKAEGLNYVHISTGFLRPDDSKFKEALQLVEDPKYQPVYVHCRTGCDRTGVIVGLYRIGLQGWSKEAAYKEMREHHFRPVFFGMKRSFDVLIPESVKVKAQVPETSSLEQLSNRD